MAAELFGDWARAHRLVDQLASRIRKGLEAGLKQACARTERAVVKHIQSQDLAWQELSPAYLAYKERAGLSEQIYIATSSYMQAITSLVDAAILRGTVGVMRSAQRKDGTVFGDIPATLEFGTKDGKTPPRPLWRPTLAEMRLLMQQILRDKVAQKLRG